MANFRRYEVQRGAKAAGRNLYYTVHPGHDHQEQKKVALHNLHPRFFEDEGSREEAWDAVVQATKVHDKHLIAVTDVDPDERMVVTEWCGRSLKDVLAQGRPTPVQVREMLRQTLMGLQRLHAKGLAHGDVRPASMLVHDQGHVCLAFSPGMLFAGSVPMRQEHQKYMAPELLNPGEFGEPGPPADLYGAGLAALELLMGTAAFEAAFTGVRGEGELRDQSWMQWHAAPGSKLAPIRTLVPNLPEDLEYVIQGLVAKSRKDRYEDAASALKDLDPPGIVEVQGSRGERSDMARPARKKKDGKGSGKWLEDNLALVCAAIFLPVVLYVFMDSSAPEGSSALKLEISPPGSTVSLARVPAEITTKDQLGGVKPKDLVGILSKEPVTTKELKLEPGHYFLGVNAAEGSEFESEWKFIDLKAKDKRLIRIDLVKKKPKIELFEITMTSEPDGAEVFAGGKLQGKTPFKDKIPAGEWSVELRKAGYKPKVAPFKVSKETTTFGPFKLDPEQAELSATTFPPGAVVTWSGEGPAASKGEGKTPVLRQKLPLGKYMLKFTMTGFEPLEQTVELTKPDEAKDLGGLPLRPLPRLVQVGSTPPGAQLLVVPRNGKDPAHEKVTPVTDLMLTPGLYELQVAKPGFASTRVAVEVGPGEGPQILKDVVLEPLPRALRVESVPAGATVELRSSEGTPVTSSPGITPMSGLSLRPGNYQVVLRLATYESKTVEVSVEAGADPLVIGPVALARERRFVEIRSVPPQAEVVLVDAAGQNSLPGPQVTDVTSLPLSVGIYQLTLKKAMFEDFQTSMSVEPGSGPQAFGPFEMKPVTRRIRIASKPDGASVTLDGTDSVTVTTCETSLTVGRHWLKLGLPGYETKETVLEVAVGEGVQEMPVVELVARKRPVRFVVETPKAELRIGKDRRLHDPGQVVEVEPGVCEVELTSKGHKPLTTSVEVLAGEGEQSVGPLALVAYPRSVKILSVPEGATVAIDDQPVPGTTPVDHELPVGEHWVRVQLAGYAALEKLVLVEAGEGQQLIGPFTVTSLPRKIRISTTPDGATVSIDGAAQGTATPLDLDLEPGKYLVKLTKPGYKEATEILKIEVATDPFELGPVRLEALPRAVTFEVAPADASILCGGQPVPAAGLVLTPGEYDLAVTHLQCVPDSRKVRVDAGEGPQKIGPIALTPLQLIKITVAPTEAEVVAASQTLPPGTAERSVSVPPGTAVTFKTSAEGFQPVEATVSFADLEKAGFAYKIALDPGLPAGLIPKEGTSFDEKLRLPKTALSKKLSEAGCPLEFVLVAPGEYRTGVPPRSGLEPGELQESIEVVENAYYVAVSEVSYDQYAAYARDAGDAAGNRWREASSKDLPVLQVSHSQAQKFADWIAPQHGRLPTEAEWEIAARGPGGSLQPWGGGEPDPSRARLHFEDGSRITGPLDLRAGDSPLGVHHLIGNVAEWCAEIYAPGSGEGPGHPGVGKWPAIRGGSWKTLPIGIRSTWRASMDPEGSDDVGIRVVVGVGR